MLEDPPKTLRSEKALAHWKESLAKKRPAAAHILTLQQEVHDPFRAAVEAKITADLKAWRVDPAIIHTSWDEHKPYGLYVSVSAQAEQIKNAREYFDYINIHALGRKGTFSCQASPDDILHNYMHISLQAENRTDLAKALGVDLKRPAIRGL